jgi:hypothetical protein
MFKNRPGLNRAPHPDAGLAASHIRSISYAEIKSAAPAAVLDEARAKIATLIGSD